MHERSPLEDKVVLVTRPEERDRSLVDALRSRGAEPIQAPTIRIEPSRKAGFARAIREAAEGRYGWVVFTSAATVAAWVSRAEEEGLETPLRSRVAAIGPATERALRAGGMNVDLVPGTFTTEALARAFPRGAGAVLLPRADVAPDGLEDALERKGWKPVRVEAYRTRPVSSLPTQARKALSEGPLHAITFTSASTVDGFVRIARVPERCRVVCIGPVTARRARDAGLTVHAVARPHTVDGLLAALERALGPRPPRSARVRASTTREAR